MQIISLFLFIKAHDESERSSYYAFLAPAYAGANVTEMIIQIPERDLIDYGVPVFDSKQEAEDHAELKCFALSA